MVKLTKDRMWLLRQFESGGWSLGRPCLQGIKKWEYHRTALIKSGLLEEDQYGMCRITDAGRAALERSEG